MKNEMMYERKTREYRQEVLEVSRHSNERECETVSESEDIRERTGDSIFIAVALTDPHQEGTRFVLWTQKQLLSLLSVYIPIIPSVKQMHIAQLNE